VLVNLDPMSHSHIGVEVLVPWGIKASYEVNTSFELIRQFYAS
jgi:hypothetical protein